MAALLLGVLLANVFVFAMASLQVAAGFFEQRMLDDPSADVGVSAAVRVLLRGLDEAGGWMGPYYLVPLFIWMACAFRCDGRPPWRRDRSTSSEVTSSKPEVAGATR